MLSNPLKSHIPDPIFNFLVKNNLLREKGVRDFKIRKRFYELKREYSSQKCIEIIHSEFPYLQFETVRKIIYQKPKLNSPEYFYLF